MNAHLSKLLFNLPIVSGFNLALCLVAFMAIGCGDADGPVEVPKPTVTVPPEDLKALVDGNNEFAFDLYKQLAKKHNGNIVFSPYSISSALAMTYAGARGETAEQMAKVLHFTLPQEKLHPAFAQLNWQLQSDKDKPYELFVANALWGQKGFGFQKEFLKLARDSYGAGLREVDFSGNPDAARKKINSWGAKCTKEKIPELLGPGDIHTNVKLVLANAIYLKAGWYLQFSKKETAEGAFEVSPGEKVSVPMMHQYQKLNCHSAAQFQLLELPYKGQRLSMVLLLPAKRHGLAELSLSGADLTSAISKLKPYMANVTLPRFKFASHQDLNESLKGMGMPLAFSQAADFSGLSADNSLWIDKAIHEAYISTDEEGTEAAAATVVTMASSLPPPFSFRADHPFLFMICDKPTCSVLFIGRVLKPSGD